jgi:lysophospholipase
MSKQDVRSGWGQGRRWLVASGHAGLASLGLAGVMRAQAAEANPYGLIPEAEHAARMASEVQPLWAQRVQRGHFTGVGGVKLAFAWVVPSRVRAAVVIVNGRTESLLKYQEVVADLVRQGYAVYTYDHRGQGLSERLLPDAPQKGHVGRFDDYVDDLQTFITQVVRPKTSARLFVLAHSMGGGIATRHLARFPGTFAAAALSSPMHQPNAKILISADASCDWFKLTGWAFSTAWAGLAARPYSHKAYEDKTNIYTHSPVRWGEVLKAEDAHPEIRLGGPTRGWADEACTASDQMISEAGRITTPVLVLQAGADTAVTPEGQRRFCAALAHGGKARCETGQPVRFEGARHELLIEADVHRVPAMTAIFDFFARQPQ